MALAIATVVDAISGLTVTGLTIKDMDQIPGAAEMRSATLLPLPDFLTNYEFERNSVGGGSIAKMTVYYQLNYRLLYKPAGAGRAIEYFDNMVSMVGLIMDAVMAIDTMSGTVDITPVSVTNMGLVNDPADNPFYGCDIAFRIMEFVN